MRIWHYKLLPYLPELKLSTERKRGNCIYTAFKEMREERKNDHRRTSRNT